MDLLFSSLPSHGHTYPLLPLAIAAREQGHHITYATAASFHAPLIALGFDVVDVGTDIHSAFAELSGSDASPIEARKRDPEEVAELAARIFTDILPRRFFGDLKPVLAARRFDLVVYEAATIGAAFAAKVAGVPAVCHAFGRGFDRVVAEESGTAGFAEGFVRIAEELLGPDAADLTPDNLAGGDPYLDIYPASIQAPAYRDAPNRVPLRPVAFSEPGELPDWVRAHAEPLIYLTLGTAFGDAGVLRTAIAGLAATGAKVLVAAGPTVRTEDLGDPPPSVTVEAWVPQAELLPHVDLVVHHGGSGTTLGSIAAGVPQLFLPQGADQFTNADAVTGAGAARTLRGDEVTAEAVTAAAKELLSDADVAARVAALAEEVAAMPSPAEVAARLPDFVRPVRPVSAER